ncbi:uncharacterized protein TRUGW13939_06073 [Talaromyces rugulosus]|uniref:Uncharacterized protein n=1 Tax=Talaromyces rugulosus TaxID=121627 RepID=A0A7H8QZR1_TALRU|nr:uncharacterized protein TRUGW13939_06073 [Talaromyces rugulosus]QKX58945.1 hypothetical protein TRUGW13939_06073 [Talaromyces rugulosus]
MARNGKSWLLFSAPNFWVRANIKWNRDLIFISTFPPARLTHLDAFEESAHLPAEVSQSKEKTSVHEEQERTVDFSKAKQQHCDDKPQQRG